MRYQFPLEPRTEGQKSNRFTVDKITADSSRAVPGFLIGGANLVGGLPTSNAGTFFVKMYVKIKKSWLLLGGGPAWGALGTPLGSTNVNKLVHFC